MRAWTAAGLLLVGLALGWMAATLLRSGPDPAARQVARAPAPSADPRLDVVLARLDAIERALLERADLSLPPAAAPTPLPPAHSGNHAGGSEVPGAPDDTHADPWAGTAPDELLLQAKVAAESEGGAAQALEMYRAVTRRDVAPDQKASALLGIADVYRRVREYGAAARAFREARDVAGPGSETGQSAWRQLGWALANGGQATEALREAEALRAEPGLSPVMRANADWMVALFAKGAGDSARARRELESIVTRYRDHPEEHMRSFATMAEKALAGLE